MTPTVIPAIFRAKDEMSAKMKVMQQSAAKFNEKFAMAGQNAFRVGRQAAIAGALIMAPLVLSAKAAVNFEEKMSDVAKTTGIQGKALTDFGDDLLAMSTKTRTSIDDLATIAEIGGQLGVAKKDLIGFTKSANEFNIALGADFSGGVEEAVSSIGKIKALFKETRDLNISDAISKTGSAINELGAVGAGTSANITDFTLRMGALPDALKMTAQNTLALGTFLEEMGIDAQISAGGMSNLLLVAGREIGGFANQMGISAQQAKLLLKQDPSEFATRFAQTFKGMAPDKMAAALQQLKIGSQETIKVIGALSSDQKNQQTGLTRLATLQDVANKSFAENLSLKSEAAKKEATAAAQMAKLKNNVQALAITIGNALLPVINDIVSAITPYVSAASEWIKRNKGLTSTIVKVAIAAGVLAFAISGVSFAIGVYQKAVVIAQAVQKAWNLVMMANPIGLMIAGAIGLAIAIHQVSKAFSGLSVAQELDNEVRSRALEKTIDQRVEMAILFNTLRKTKQGTDEYKNALAKIDQMSPGLIEKYKLQEKSLRNISLAEKELTASIMKRAEQEARAEILREKMKENIKLKTEDFSTWEMIKSLGSKEVAKMNRVPDLVKSNAEVRKLSDDVAKDQLGTSEAANPELAKLKGQKLDININGLPNGSSAEMNGKKINTTSGGNMPKLATNL